MSETMIERVARAIYEGRNGRGCKHWSRLPASHRAPYFADARAVAKALRDPTEGMIAAGQRFARESDEYEMSCSDWFVAGQFTAMIDASLNERTE